MTSIAIQDKHDTFGLAVSLIAFIFMLLYVYIAGVLPYVAIGVVLADGK